MPMPTKWKALPCLYTAWCAALLLLFALPQPGRAADDDDPPGRVARLRYLQGSISFQPAGASDWSLAGINRPMTTGDKLWVDEASRAEVQLGSAAIRLGSKTGFSFLNLDDHTVQIQLSAGTLSMNVRHLDRDEIFEVDTPNQAFSILQPGHYRLYADEDGNTTTVTVRDGQGEANGAGRTYTIESGQIASLTGTESLDADLEPLEPRDRDDFDAWCEDRDRRDERSVSMQHVSHEMVGYEDLDDNGRWRHDSAYGDIWVPTAIPAGWAPYHYGHWAWISPWGWTWVDDAPWGYAPFHYGRWVYAEGAWCWVPGPVAVRPVYAPALVAFVGGAHFSIGVAVGGPPVVGWFPLGPREVYVPAYRVSPAYVNRVNVSNTNVSNTTITNVYNTTVINNVNTTQVTKINYVNRSAPGAVTAVPQASFANAQSVSSAAVAVNQRQIAAAQVTTRAEVAPTKSSLAGPVVAANARAATPPPAVVNRPVVAKVAPPPPPVPFERQQAALAQHPGQPLARQEAESLRPASGPTAHPLVRSAAEPANTNGKPGAVVPANAAGPPRKDLPAGFTPAEQPNAGRRNEGPGEPRNIERSGQGVSQPGAAQPPNHPLTSEPVNAAPPAPRGDIQPSNPPANATFRNDRPASAQPNYRPPAANQPNQAPRSEPASSQPTMSPHDQPGSRPAPPQHAPAAQPSNSRMEQPANRPASQPANSRTVESHGNPTVNRQSPEKRNVESPREDKQRPAKPAAAPEGKPPRNDNKDKEKDEKR